MKVRVYELARELGLTSRETMELCAAVGIGVSSASSGLDEERAQLVRHQVYGAHPSTAPRLVALPGGRSQSGEVDGPPPSAVARPTLTLVAPSPAAPAPTGQPASCVLCRATPAADVRFRQCTGRAWRAVVDEVAGPFCRDCGEVVFRDATDETWITGWWGVPAFFVNWTVVARNLLARRTVLALPAPVRPDHPDPGPMPLGRPLARRPSAAVAALMLVATVALLVALGSVAA